MSFSQALSGLNAQQQKLGAVGNNIANSQTVGFKSSNVQFADVFAQSRIGLGTRVSGVLQDFSQGNVESTNRNMDLAIAGEGFFRFQQPGGEVGYSRNGQLTMTPEGELVNAQGARIMGYAANADGEVQPGGDVEAFTVDTDDMEASATDNVSMTLNLDSGEPAITGGIDTAEPSTYNFSTNATVFDSQGNGRNLTVYFQRQFVDDTANPLVTTNNWAVHGRLSGGPDGGGEYEGPIGTLSFNESGTLPEDGFDFVDPGDSDIVANDADGNPQVSFTEGEFDQGNDGLFENLEFSLNFNGSSQFANDSTVNNVNQDGYTSGSLVGVIIEDDGTVVRNYSNEQSLAAGQIALVSFRNPEGLRPVGDNLWSATGSSGQELVGAPGTGQRGLIEASAIETSNVDLAAELVDMIVSQRAYQANSQTISTQDELLQTIINL
ncbi:flagellar hook protein FlgE [Vreelandella massiliensis]|uniref:flagellar hook protein FlgE n=1 Tax=Vreelandella massiliensis TaxID=1816686 RepID=UPI00096A3CC4|nr:flagellar hook protein FlgE [Halomonas massiliensis]